MATEYSLADVLKRLYQNQLALEAAVMELTLRAECQGATDVSKMSAARYKWPGRTPDTLGKAWPN